MDSKSVSRRPSSPRPRECAPSTARAPMSATVATMRILVVEDDKLLSEGLVSVLSRAGHAVDYTASGKYADTLLAQESYDLLVLDVGLPDIDGFEVLRRVRARHSPIGVL